MELERLFELLLLLSCVQRPGYSQGEPLKLQLASVVFRHGDRSPVDSYPKDVYKEDYWPQGFGQLSTTGMRQEHFLGQLLRDRYVGQGLITSNYTRVQVHVRSTDYDRTLMSAESLLAGLFPPEGDQIFHPSIPWQPIPVHAIPKDHDSLLRAYNADCSKYSHLREQDKKSSEYRQIENENKELIRRLEENTGIVPTTLDDVWTVQDTLFVQSLSNISLPGWLEPGDWERLTDLSAYTLSLMFSSTEKSRLVGGNWVGKVVGDMKTRRDSPKDDMRLYLYSAHDTTVAAMATALGVYNGLLPPYSTALTVELYSDSSGEYWVSLFYRNDTYGTDLWPLQVESCANTALCTLAEFEKHVAPVIPGDWEEECQLPGGNNNSTIIITVAVLLVVVVTILGLVPVLLIVLRRRNRRRNQRNTKTHLVTAEDEDL